MIRFLTFKGFISWALKAADIWLWPIGSAGRRQGNVRKEEAKGFLPLCQNFYYSDSDNSGNVCVTSEALTPIKLDCLNPAIADEPFSWTQVTWPLSFVPLAKKILLVPHCCRYLQHIIVPIFLLSFSIVSATNFLY